MFDISSLLSMNQKPWASGKWGWEIKFRPKSHPFTTSQNRSSLRLFLPVREKTI